MPGEHEGPCLKIDKIGLPGRAGRDPRQKTQIRLRPAHGRLLGRPLNILGLTRPGSHGAFQVSLTQILMIIRMKPC